MSNKIGGERWGRESLLSGIVGTGGFVEVKLAEKLVEMGLNVVFFGKWREGREAEEIKNQLEDRRVLLLRSEEQGFLEKINYLFVLEEAFSNKWQEQVEEWGAKAVRLTGFSTEGKAIKGWRELRSEGVYGEIMGRGEGGWLGKILGQAVENEKLQVPKEVIDKGARVLYVDDLVEALVRACFLPGTEGESFGVVGEKVEGQELVRFLGEKAALTRGYEIVDGEVGSVLGEERGDGERLGWEAKIGWREGVERVLQNWMVKKDRGTFEEGEKEKRREKRRNPLVVEVYGEEEKEEERGGERRREEVVEIKVKAEEKIAEIEKEKEESKERREEKSKQNKLGEAKKAIGKSQWDPVDEGERKRRIREILGREVEEQEEEKKEKLSPVFRSFVPEEVDLTWEEEEEKQKEKEGGKGKEREVEKKTKKTRGRLREIVKWSLVFSFLFLVMGIGKIGWHSLAGWRNLRKIPGALVSKNWIWAEDLAKESQGNFEKAGIWWKNFGGEEWSTGREIGDVFYLGQRAAVTAEETVKVAEKSVIMWEKVWQEGEGVTEAETEAWGREMDQVDGSLAYLQAQMKRPWGWWFKRWERDKQKWAEQLGEGRSYWQKMRLILPNLGEMLGMAGGRKDYLVLLQNEMELRPTGGFIGSLAILTFQDGRMMNLEVLDVYSADGQLKGHVEPPAEIKEYLGEANWYLRDVNWDPDFAVVAGKAEWFFEKEMGRKVDGVIAFNLGAAKAMLAALGKVSLGDYGEEITADNLFEQAEFYAENKFFPGSQEKANFLGLLAKELLVELKSSGPEEWGRLALGMMGSLEKKEIQVFLNDKDSQRNLETLGWDGRVREVVCKGENCVSDYLMIVEANLGVNKANYFIKRLVEQVVELTAASINRTVKISYENTARSDAWPAGIYKNYVRVLLPGDVRVLGVKIRDLGTGVEEETKWTEKRYGSKKELGFLVKVPVSGKRQVEVSYQTVRAITGEELRYAYLLQKQSGWQETNLNLLITADSQWRPLQVQPAASLVGGKLLFSELLDRDLEIGVEWGK